MGYFSNGAEGMDYQELHCWDGCINWRDLGDGRGEGCPIWDVHLFNNVDQINEQGVRDGPVYEILRTLIPDSEDGLRNERCAMYLKEAPP